MRRNRKGDYTGIAGFDIKLNYDKEYLTPVSITKGDALVDGNFTSNLTDETDGATLDSVTAYWSCAYDMDENGELFTVDFLVNEDVEAGQTIPVEISCDNDGICDYTLSDISSSATQGVIKVTGDSSSSTADGDLQNGYYIPEIIMKSNDNTVEYDTIPANGNFNMNLTIEGIFDDEILPNAEVLVAAYGEDDCLISLNKSDIPSGLDTNGECSVSIGATDKTISHLKIFIWDSLKTMNPYMESLGFYGNAIDD